MKEVTYNGLTFEPFINRERIDRRIAELAKQIEKDCEGKRPVFLCVLNGAFPFAADLFRNVEMDAEISFIRLQSYQGMSTTGVVKETVGISDDLTDRTVIIVEDIIDTGNTIRSLINSVEKHNPAEIKVATLLYKPESVKGAIQEPDYVGFSIPSRFIIGFGLDLDGLARNLPEIYVLKETPKTT